MIGLILIFFMQGQICFLVLSVWETARTLHFIEILEDFGPKIGVYTVIIMTTRRFVSTRGPGHSLVFDPGHFLNISNIS